MIVKCTVTVSPYQVTLKKGKLAQTLRFSANRRDHVIPDDFYSEVRKYPKLYIVDDVENKALREKIQVLEKAIIGLQEIRKNLEKTNEFLKGENSDLSSDLDIAKKELEYLKAVDKKTTVSEESQEAKKTKKIKGSGK